MVSIDPPASSPATWQRLGGEWDTVTVPAETTVRYGANGVYVQKVVSGTFRATNEFFGGDPVPGVLKAVDALVGGQAGAAPASTAWQSSRRCGQPATRRRSSC